MIRKKWKIESLLTFFTFLLLIFYLSYLLKNRSCKRLRQMEVVVTAPRENLGFEEALMLERLKHVKNVCQEIEAPSNDCF